MSNGNSIIIYIEVNVILSKDYESHDHNDSESGSTLKETGVDYEEQIYKRSRDMLNLVKSCNAKLYCVGVLYPVRS